MVVNPYSLIQASPEPMYLEEINLSTIDADPEMDQPLEAADKVAALEQAIWMRRCRSQITLFSNKRLSVATQRFMQDAHDYTIDIGILDPHPKRVFKVDWSCLLIFFALCGIATILAISGRGPNAVMLSISLLAFAGASLLLAVYRSRDRIVFYSQHARTPLVVLFNRSPDRVTLDSFIDILVGHIKDARDHSKRANEVLNEELKEHRRLMEEGAISGRRYDIVKQRILSQHS